MLGATEKIQRRIMRILDGIAATGDWGSDILLVLDDEEACCPNVGGHCRDADRAFAARGGLHIHEGRGHVVTMKMDPHTIVPGIARAMTHGCLVHLPILAFPARA